jgi:hypothetical protein
MKKSIAEDKLDAYVCGWEDATGEVPPKEQIMNYLRNTLRLTEIDALELIDDNCEGWWDHEEEEDD